ncbi:hypothetical protein ECZU23_32560 [Escherichia coli]|nr:hypothetical protein ECZU20_23780 [Escherichia coli]GHL14813.1 hypothetical protein ECZU23_32560 [Escherichia coli]
MRRVSCNARLATSPHTAKLVAQVFNLLPCPLVILILFIPLLPARFLLWADALAA